MGAIEAVRGPQSQLRNMGLSMGERAMPREEDFPSKVACAEVQRRQHGASAGVCVQTLATEKLREPRADVDAWENPRLPHNQLDLTVVDAEALH